MHMGSATDIETAAQDAVLREQEIVTQKIIHGQREARGESGLLEDVLYILSGRQDPNAIKEHLLKMTTDHRAEMALKRGKSNSPEGGNMKIGNRYGGPGGGAYYGASRPNFLTSSSKITFVGWYLGMIKSRPILTKSITSALIYTAADLSSQTLSQQTSESYDLARTLRMAGYGMIVLGPTLHFWFNFVSKVLPKTDLIATLKKIIMGQTIYGPTMTVVFFSLNAALQGENGSEIIARLKRDLVPTLIGGVMYWPFCDFITFRFIPVHLQPLVSNSFSYLWTVYLTYMASLEKTGSAL